MKLYQLTLHIQDTSSVSNVLDIQTTDALWDGDVDSSISPHPPYHHSRFFQSSMMTASSNTTVMKKMMTQSSASTF